MKKRVSFSSLWVCLLTSGMVFVSCNNPAGQPVDYPYIQYQMEYMGTKSGLTSSSTDKAFHDGLEEIYKSWKETHLISDEDNIDGVIYGLTNSEYIKFDDVPRSVYYLFWEELRKKEDNDVGSCFWFNYYKIPDKKRTGEYYQICAIVVEKNYQISGYFIKADIYPK